MNTSIGFVGTWVSASRIFGFAALFSAGLLNSGCSSKNQSMTANKDKRPLVVFVTGDHEYSGEATLPIVAAELEKNYGMRTKVLKASPNQNSEENIPGLEAHAFRN